MNRKQFTERMIKKGYSQLESDKTISSTFEESLLNLDFESEQDLANQVLDFCYKQDSLRPEVFLDKHNEVSQKVFDTPEKQKAFVERLTDYQRQEAIVSEFAQNKDEVAKLTSLGLMDSLKETMLFNPQHIDDLEKVYENAHGLSIGQFPQEPRAYEALDFESNENEMDRDIDLMELKEEVNQVIDTPVQNPLQKPEPEEMSEDEVKQQVKSYQDHEQELFNELQESFSFDKGLFKHQVFDSDNNSFGTFTKNKTGKGYSNASLQSGASVNLIKLAFAGTKPPILQSANESEFDNIVQAWKELKEDGFDISKLEVGKDAPECYHQALKELKGEALSIGAPKNKQEVEKPENKPDEPKNEQNFVQETNFDNDDSEQKLKEAADDLNLMQETNFDNNKVVENEVDSPKSQNDDYDMPEFNDNLDFEQIDELNSEIENRENKSKIENSNDSEQLEELKQETNKNSKSNKNQQKAKKTMKR
ncbi:hypothetical protein A0H77_19440 [Vibrio alginolyticus]|uniref:hypothetical protein n=1 Tax=Vibrio alginolyticus TaxID=663 RepID=UPI00079B42BE|nr:hypothetical protein [Vibrio alginolyticus]KXZ35072.1 hypothetical protein A0H77_19440 [Vibrio alginolyticus]